MRRLLPLLCPFALLAAASVRADGPPTRFGLTLHVGTDDDGRPVATREALTRWVADASAPYAAADLAFEVEAVRSLERGSAVLRTIRDRHRLSRHLAPRRINVFVVGRIEDPHPSEATRRAAAQRGFEPSGRLGGAHIRAPRHVPETYLIVRAGSDPTTLSHELGHFFGAGHHRDARNIMSYGRERHRFDDRQIAAFRHFARRYVRQRALRPL